MANRLVAWLTVLIVVGGCSDDVDGNAGGQGGGDPVGGGEVGGGQVGGGGSSATDGAAPTATISSPAPGAVVAGATLTVSGAAADASEIAAIEVNGVLATTSDGFATFTAEIDVELGENTIVVSTRDVHDNADAFAASIDVVRDDGPPVIAELFPPSFAGFEGDATTVFVRASDPSGIESVTVGAIAAELRDGDVWVAADVPAGDDIAIEVLDGAGRATESAISLNASQPFADGLFFLQDAGGGTMVGLHYLRGELVRFNRFSSPQIEILSGPTRGSGPPLPESIGVLGLALVGGEVLVGFSTGPNDLAVIAVDLVTGDRTAVGGCTLPESPTGFGAGGNPLRYYATLWDPPSLFVCDPNGTIVDTADLAIGNFYQSKITYDEVTDRAVIAGDAGATIVAFDSASGVIDPINLPAPELDDPVRALTVIDGQTFYLTDGGVYRTTDSLMPEAIGAHVGGWAVGIAGCSNDGSTEVCVNGLQMSVLSDTGDAWSSTPIPRENSIGVGDVTSPIDAVAVPDGPDGPRMIYSTTTGGLYVLDMATGERENVAEEGFYYLTQVLPSGLVVGGDNGLFMMNVLDDTPAIMPVPGQFEPSSRHPVVVPAGTRAVNEAVIYRSSTTLRVRDLVTGEDSVLTDPGDAFIGLAAAADGALYLGHFYERAIYVIPAGNTTPELLVAAGTSELASLTFDDESRSVVWGTYSAIRLVNVDTLEVAQVPYTELSSSMAPPPRWNAGPWPGTLIAAPDGIGNSLVLLDLQTRAAFVLAR